MCKLTLDNTHFTDFLLLTFFTFPPTVLHLLIAFLPAEDGDYWRLLNPGTHIVTATAKGYSKVSKRVYLPHTMSKAGRVDFVLQKVCLQSPAVPSVPPSFKYYLLPHLCSNIFTHVLHPGSRGARYWWPPLPHIRHMGSIWPLQPVWAIQGSRCGW